MFVLCVVVLAGTGLFAIQYHHRRSQEAIGSLLTDGELLDGARSAQVAFKLQVQEWKNVLLRSSTPEALQERLAQFTAAEAEVDRRLGGLVSAPGLSDQLRGDARSLVEAHHQLGERYRDALHAYVPGQPQTIFAVDAAVRGIDRRLNDGIDALADGIVANTRGQAAQLRDRGEEEYRTLRSVVSTVAVVAILLSGLLAWLAMRPPRPRPA